MVREPLAVVGYYFVSVPEQLVPLMFGEFTMSSVGIRPLMHHRVIQFQPFARGNLMFGLEISKTLSFAITMSRSFPMIHGEFLVC